MIAPSSGAPSRVLRRVEEFLPKTASTRTMSCTTGRRTLLCVAALAAFGHRTEAAGFCQDDDGGGGSGDFVACLKAKAIAALDRASRVHALPIAGTAVTLVREPQQHREQRSDEPAAAAATVTERELLSKPDAALDAMLYDKAVELLRGRSLRVGLSELATGTEEGKHARH